MATITTQPLQVGVTGGIGSGKSLVCKIFHSMGAPVYDADSHAKELMQSDAELVEGIKQVFRKQAYESSGRINRQYIAQQVFGKPDQLEKLNQLVHPRVAFDYGRWVAGHSDKFYVIKEAALIFEAGSYKTLDKVVVVSAPEAVRMTRVLQRDSHRVAKDIENIFRSQMSEEEKLARADFVILNDESKLVIPQVLELHNLFVQGR